MPGDPKNNATFIMPSPAAAPPRALGSEAPAVLLVVSPPGKNLGRRFTLAAAEHFIGRSTDLDISIEEEAVSRRHARLSRGDGSWVIEDLASTNGSFVNDARVSRQVVRDGDLIRCGTAILKFLAGSNIEAEYHEEIYKMSIIDGLTSVHNKRYFLEFLDREAARAIRHKQPLSLVMFDIDHFKSVNDTHGHLAGDAVLKELAARIKPKMRKEDLFARYGGEEFACILTNTTVANAVRFAEKVRLCIAAQPFALDGKTLPVTISLGAAQLDDSRATPATLIGRADENLYAAKRAGRNRVVG
jgi:diguanylate cyclase (GGDEF)-like protein